MYWRYDIWISQLCNKHLTFLPINFSSGSQFQKSTLVSLTYLYTTFHKFLGAFYLFYPFSGSFAFCCILKLDDEKKENVFLFTVNSLSKFYSFPDLCHEETKMMLLKTISLTVRSDNHLLVNLNTIYMENCQEDNSSLFLFGLFFPFNPFHVLLIVYNQIRFVICYSSFCVSL